MNPFLFKKNKTCKTGQSFLEFSFAMIMTVLLMVGLIKVFLWTGDDLVKRRQAHERVLLQTINSDATGPLQQLRSTFYTGEGIDVAVNSNIYGNPF